MTFLLRTPYRIANGHVSVKDGEGTRRISTSYPSELFDQINAIAIRDNVSFSEAVRGLIRQALDG